MDGRALGPAPLKRAAFVGAHEVALALEGYEPGRATTEVKDGLTARVELALRKIPPPPRPRAAPLAAAPVAQSTPIYRRWWFWTGIAVVAAGATAGAVAGSYYSGNNTTGRTFTNPILLFF